MAIYRVRRFSTINQKEFGWIRNKLSKTISEEEQKMGYNLDDLEINPRVMNPDVENKMVKDNKELAELSPKSLGMRSPSAFYSGKKQTRLLKDSINNPENNFF